MPPPAAKPGGAVKKTLSKDVNKETKSLKQEKKVVNLPNGKRTPGASPAGAPRKSPLLSSALGHEGKSSGSSSSSSSTNANITSTMPNLNNLSMSTPSDNSNIAIGVPSIVGFEKNGLKVSIEYSKPGIQHKQLLQLKKGKIPISASIDLHEKNRIEARELLVHCIYNAQQNHHKCIKIVHGKGNSTPENIYPIMKNYTYSLLKKHQEVLAFCSAKYNDGGTGAVYVLLKKGKEHD